jgi:3-hydroxyisobutyrate dehydrogenase
MARAKTPAKAPAKTQAAAQKAAVSGHKTIGWIGLGRMGEAMVKRLLKAGFDVAVWNRTHSKALPLVEYGARLVTHKLDLAFCDTVFTMVSTTDDLKEVLFAEGGLVTGKRRPKLVIDSSSISQEGSIEVRVRLEALGIGYLCAPVSGNAKVAKAGKLLVVVSGPLALYESAKPSIEALGRSVIRVGDGELARVWKIAHNTMFGVVIQSLCEITVLAEKAGIARHVFLDSINNSVLGSMYTRYKSPTLTNLTFDQVTFTPKLLLKDMDLGLGAAHAHGVSMPCAAATRESIASLVGRGHDEVDFSILLLETARNAGLSLVPENVKVSDGLET